MTTTALTRAPGTAPSQATARRGRLLVLVVPHRDHIVVLVTGEADCCSAPLLREGLARGLYYRPRSLLVDATDLTFCDLHGLDALVDGIETVERSGACVTVHPSPQLVWLVATLQRLPWTSGRPGRDLAGCPLPRPVSAPA